MGGHDYEYVSYLALLVHGSGLMDVAMRHEARAESRVEGAGAVIVVVGAAGGGGG